MYSYIPSPVWRRLILPNLPSASYWRSSTGGISWENSKIGSEIGTLLSMLGIVQLYRRILSSRSISFLGEYFHRMYYFALYVLLIITVKHWKWCPWHRKASAKTQVSLTRFLQSEVKIIHIIVQNNTYYNTRSRWTKQQHFHRVKKVNYLWMILG